MNSRVDLFAIVVFGTGTDSFHGFVLVSRSQFAFLTEFVSFGDHCESLAGWASLVKKVDDFIVLHGSRSVRVDRGDSGGMNLSQNWVIIMGSRHNKVDGVLFHVESNADFPWDADSHGANSFDGVSGSEGGQMVVDSRNAVHVHLNTDFVVSGHGCSGLVGSDLGVNANNASNGRDGGDWDTKFIGLKINK